VAEIRLHNGMVAIVDDADISQLSSLRWYAKRDANTCYAYTVIRIGPGKVRYQLMHRILVPGFPVVDHRNGNGLDNRRINLRGCTQRQNLSNQGKFDGASSRFKGVTWDKRRRVWQAKVTSQGKDYRLGNFDDETAAARAYDEAARHHFGSYARLNFPSVGEGESAVHGMRSKKRSERIKRTIIRSTMNDQEIGTIPLNNGTFAVVDAADIPIVEGRHWSSNSNGYAVASFTHNGRVRWTRMHRLLLLGLDSDCSLHVDHINGDRLDNRRSNLRLVTSGQNQSNRRKKVNSKHRFKGVNQDRRDLRWEARIRSKGAKYYIGRFATEEEAARAYDVAAREHFGEFARLNFPTT
jgi:hypothetical protein